MSIPPNSDHVKAPRRYDSARRRAQAAQTRLDILDAALSSFLESGYAGSTIVNVAAGPGVAVETIYRAFGSKGGLFKAVVEAAIAGGAARAAIPVEERPAIRAMIEETDPHRVLQLHAATQPGIHGRVGPLNLVLMEAAANDPELADVKNQLEAERLAAMRRIARSLKDRGGLRPEISVDEAGDMLWTVNSPAVYDMLVVQRRWSAERYRNWIASTNAHSLLAGRSRRVRRKGPSQA